MQKLANKMTAEIYKYFLAIISIKKVDKDYEYSTRCGLKYYFKAKDIPAEQVGEAFDVTSNYYKIVGIDGNVDELEG